jgi:DNA-binding MarR family transcriptional regulator
MQDDQELTALMRKWLEAYTLRSQIGWHTYIKAAGLSMPQFSLLMQLFHKGSCGVNVIGGWLDVTSAAASQLVDRLVHAGLVDRTENPADRRARQVTLSPRGLSFIAKAMEERFRWVDELAAVLSKEEKAVVRKALPVLVEAEKRMSPRNKRDPGPSLPARST